MTLAVTGTYAAALAGLFLLLTARVIVYRRAERINLGDGSDPVMLRRIRAQGNFVETVPLALILLAIAELQGEAPGWLHLTGGLLLAGRLAHGLNFSFDLKQMQLRVGGMGLTLVAILLGAGLALPF
jgi:uncharacterized protein